MIFLNFHLKFQFAMRWRIEKEVVTGKGDPLYALNHYYTYLILAG